MAHPCKTKRASVGRHEERTEVDIRGGRNVLRPHKSGTARWKRSKPPGRRGGAWATQPRGPDAFLLWKDLAGAYTCTDKSVCATEEEAQSAR
jgi:hypothetical protein